MDTIHAASVMDSHPDLSPFLARQSPAVILQFGYGSLIFRQRCTYAVVVGVCVPLPRPLGGRPVLELDYRAVPSIGLERYIPNGVQQSTSSIDSSGEDATLLRNFNTCALSQ